MLHRHIIRFIGYVCACIALGSCTYPTVPTTPAAKLSPFTAIEPRQGETLLQVDTQKSLIQIYTYRGGRLAKFGHNHVIAARNMNGTAALTQTLSGSRFKLRIPLAMLTVDEPVLRTAAGSDFSSKPTAEDIAATRANMLGPDGLAASQFPAALVNGAVTAVNNNRATMTITLQVHGQSITLADQDSYTEVTAAGVRLHGQLHVRQSELGITPFSALGGALRVLDEVTIHYDVVARP